MKICKYNKLFVFISLFLHAIRLSALDITSKDLIFHISGIYKPELQFGDKISLLNNNNPQDKIFFMRHTADFNFDVIYGNESYGCKAAEFLFTLRNRAIWGNPASIASTTRSEIPLLGAAVAPHSHGIPRLFFWMREGWLWLDLCTAFGLNIDTKHSFSLGAFSFRLGRGIALGDAYAVGPENLGFYTDAIVDQYAFGGKLSGEIFKNALTYELYSAILQNRSSSLSETGEKIFGQQFGRLNNPARGFGSINYIIASKFMWTVFNDETIGKLLLEPYALYNSDPEQLVEFRGDSTSKLGTIGFAGEYLQSRFEFGFDYAFNLGRQLVKGWDRNQVSLQNNNGQAVIVNSHVVSQDNKKIPFIANGDAQNIISNPETFQSESQNGQQIGVLPAGVGYLPGPITLINSANRYRNPYTNKYQGYMFITDAAFWMCNRSLRLAVMAAVASGDDNPNEQTMDQVYSGFIGLQEIYSGNRVQSVFVLGGAGKLPRPLSAPHSNQVPSKFPQTVSRFTNLVLGGTGLFWEPAFFDKKFNLKTNLIACWQQFPSQRFDLKTRKEVKNSQASTFLGIETNMFTAYQLLKNTRVFCVGSLFFPGQHYKDIRGLPLNADQERILSEFDVDGFTQDRVPNIGSNIAYTLNLGLEFLF